MKTENINMALADSLKLEEGTIYKIDRLQTKLNRLLRCPHVFVDSPADVEEIIKEIEFTLQGLWGFDQSVAYHRYGFYVKGCTCPKIDNDEMVGATERRIYSSDCPYHGTNVAMSWDDERFTNE